MVPIFSNTPRISKAHNLNNLYRGQHGPLTLCSTMVEPDPEALQGLNRTDDGKTRVFLSKHEVFLCVAGKHEVSVENLQICRVWMLRVYIYISMYIYIYIIYAYDLVIW